VVVKERPTLVNGVKALGFGFGEAERFASKDGKAGLVNARENLAG
jgi:hypothetical protein